VAGISDLSLFSFSNPGSGECTEEEKESDKEERGKILDQEA